MSLLARAPRLAVRSARSNVLVQSRGMHGECEVRVSHRNPRFQVGKLRNAWCNASHSTTGRRFLSPQRPFPLPASALPRRYTNEWIYLILRPSSVLPSGLCVYRQLYASFKNSGFSVNICKHFCLPFVSSCSNSCPRPHRVCSYARRHLHFSTIPSDSKIAGLHYMNEPRFRRRGLLSAIVLTPTDSASPTPHQLYGGRVLSVGP